MEYTDWFNPEVKPVNVGIYEIEDVIGGDDDIRSAFVTRCFAVFNGENFGYAVWSDEGIIDVEELYSEVYKVSHHNNAWTNGMRWRGVKKET